MCRDERGRRHRESQSWCGRAPAHAIRRFIAASDEENRPENAPFPIPKRHALRFKPRWRIATTRTVSFGNNGRSDTDIRRMQNAIDLAHALGVRVLLQLGQKRPIGKVYLPLATAGHRRNALLPAAYVKSRSSCHWCTRRLWAKLACSLGISFAVLRACMSPSSAKGMYGKFSETGRNMTYASSWSPAATVFRDWETSVQTVWAFQSKNSPSIPPAPGYHLSTRYLF
jgi:hypothetical protein